MKANRIYAMVLRYLFYFRHSLDRMTDAFYWPTVDLLLWGLTSAYFRQYAPGANIIATVITGIIFWIIVWRSQYEISVNLLDELWNENLVNLFVSPLKFFEWIISFLIIGVIKGILSFSFALLVAFALYKINLFFFGFYFIPLVFLLFISGWWIGFIISGIILRFGTNVQTLAWAGIMVISPFSAIYYPLSILPTWAQKVASFVPTSYVFEGAREIVNKGHLDWNKVLISLLLNIVYLIFSLIFFRKSFDKVLEKGLVKVF